MQRVRIPSCQLEIEIHFHRSSSSSGIQSKVPMSSLAEISAPRSRRLSAAKIIFWTVIVVLVLVLALAGYGYLVARSALPQLDGQIQAKGLTGPVTVTRDGHGVPTIQAANFDDLFFAQGYVTAQDRLWQMDVIRRAGSGELSEILGPETLEFDREQRILGMRAAAKKSIGMADTRNREFFEAYARGVNAYIDSRHDKL